MNTASKNRKFKVSIKKNNNFAYFINIDNSDDFYIYKGSWVNALKKKDIFPETDLRIEGSYVTHVSGIF